MISWATLSFIIHYILLISLLISIYYLVFYISSISFVVKLKDIYSILGTIRQVMKLIVEFYKNVFIHLFWYTKRVIPILIAILIIIKISLKIYFQFSTDDREFIFILQNTAPFGFKFSDIINSISFNNLLLKIKFLKLYETLFTGMLTDLKLTFLVIFKWVSSITKGNLLFALKFVLTLPIYFVKHIIFEGYASLVLVLKLIYSLAKIIFWPLKYINYNEKMYANLIIDITLSIIIFIISFLNILYNRYKIKDLLKLAYYGLTRFSLFLFVSDLLIRLVMGLDMFFKRNYYMRFPYKSKDIFKYFINYFLDQCSWLNSSFCKFTMRNKSLFEVVRINSSEIWQGYALVGCLILLLYVSMVLYIIISLTKPLDEEHLLEKEVAEAKLKKITKKCAKLVFICLLSSFMFPKFFNFFIIFTFSPFILYVLKTMELFYFFLFKLACFFRLDYIMFFYTSFFTLVVYLSIFITLLMFLKYGILKKSGYIDNLFSSYLIYQKTNNFKPNSWQKQQHSYALLSKMYVDLELKKKYSFTEFIRLQIRKSKNVDLETIGKLDKEEVNELISIGVHPGDFMWKSDVEKNEIRKEGFSSFKKRIELQKSKIKF